ncbi:hypothetical protein H8B06_18670 [Sphingobacterium sp. DN00404]|uniref:Uncharacterized protein n=1 Tax=Sphingobacterium micropteri TaxID=2763501 RepID=A0ABR7YU72_9SPHI|nr:hypothetical protein [Sphingobacterium micropteri]MBD1434854.1 hypothetical protein [Sphingobacterium micropteri]
MESKLVYTCPKSPAIFKKAMNDIAAIINDLAEYSYFKECRGKLAPAILSMLINGVSANDFKDSRSVTVDFKVDQVKGILNTTNDKVRTYISTLPTKTIDNNRCIKYASLEVDEVNDLVIAPKSIDRFKECFEVRLNGEKLQLFESLLKATESLNSTRSLLTKVGLPHYDWFDFISEDRNGFELEKQSIIKILNNIQ